MQCYFLASKAAAFIAEKLSRSFTFMFLDYSIYVLTAVCCWFICIWRVSTFQLLYPARTCEIKPEALRKNSIWCVSLRICFYMWWFVAVRSLPTPGLLRWTLQDPTLSCWEHLHPICCHSKGACSAHLRSACTFCSGWRRPGDTSLSFYFVTREAHSSLDTPEEGIRR